MSECPKCGEPKNNYHAYREFACGTFVHSDGVIAVEGVECLCNRLSAAEQERDRLREELDAARFSQKGDNHHNSVRCPYCNPEYEKWLAELAALRAQVQRADELAVAVDGLLLKAPHPRWYRMDALEAALSAYRRGRETGGTEGE